ncbi:MAG: polyprenyl synthetase family protein [Rhodoferax sp.]
MDARVTGNSGFDLSAWSAARLAQIERALELWVNADPTGVAEGGSPAELIAAMRYAVLGGGKRLRPLLVLAAAQAASGERVDAANTPEVALRAACAVELIHAYSLVHDDLPCMDNDVLRRGKATVHVKFGEAGALLAGDALQAMAFELLTPDGDTIPPRQQAALCRLLARAAGSGGMAGGQAIDLASVGVALSERQLRQMHRLKTGALLQASVMMGAACAEVSTQAQDALMAYGAAIGLAFQVVDDILDVTADSSTLGKTAGKDAEHDKPTFVSLLGLARAGDYAQELLAEALAALARSGLSETQALQALATRVVNRAS